MEMPMDPTDQMDPAIGSYGADPDALAESQEGPFGGAPPPQAPTLDLGGMSEEDLVQLCRETKEEARSGRQSGKRSRDDIWRENLQLYNGEIDWSDKQPWQHQEVFRDATKHVDRFAAACKRGVMAPGEWYAIKDRVPGSDLLNPMVRRLIDTQLDACATTVSGAETGFRHVFSRVLRMGGVMTMAMSVQKDPYRNRIRCDEVDPRELFYDPTGRGMYRLRSREVDAHELLARASQVDASGAPLFHRDRVLALTDMRRDVAEQEGEETRGHSEGSRPLGRRTRLEDEFLFRELVNRDGVLVGRNVLVVMGNEQRIIRGPEPNPCWHGKDWIVCQSLLDTFLTVYGRAYMEDFAAACRTYIRFVALVLDGATVSLLPNYAVKPDMLQDPSQIDDGLRPFKMWLVNDEAVKAEEFAHRMELGRVYPETITIMQGLKSEMREGAMQNQVDLGAFPQKSGITATENNNVKEAGSELVQDVAENIDDGLLGPVLELIFWTAIQELDFQDPSLVRSLGRDIAAAFETRRQEFRDQGFSFKAAAITALAQRAVRSGRILQAMQVIGQSEILTQEFLKSHSLEAVLGTLWRDMGIDEPEYQRTAADGPVPVPPADQAAIEADRAAAERHRLGQGTDERRARAAEQQSEIAQRAAELEQQRAAQEGSAE